MIRGDMELDEELPIPEDCYCPILQEVMKRPVIAADGHSYEERAITKWINNCQERGILPRSPRTNVPLANLELKRNFTLESVIDGIYQKMTTMQREALENRRASINLEQRLAAKEAELEKLKHKQVEYVAKLATIRSSQDNDQLVASF